MKPSISDRRGVFIREVIARSHRRGDSAILHPDLEKYESIALSGRCVLFPLLSLAEETDYYGEACDAVVGELRRCVGGRSCDVAGGDRSIYNLQCADCVLRFGRYGLQLSHAGPGSFEEGMYIVNSEEYFYALRLGGDEATMESYPFIFCMSNATARMILEAVMSTSNIYRYMPKVLRGSCS